MGPGGEAASEGKKQQKSALGQRNIHYCTIVRPLLLNKNLIAKPYNEQERMIHLVGAGRAVPLPVNLASTDPNGSMVRL